MAQQPVMKPPARQQVSTPPITGTIKGEAYPLLNISGNRYAKVHQRVESAHKNGGYTVLSCEYKEIFDVRVCEVWIELPSGQKFPGTAEIDPTKKNPLAAGQTRAIGRALAFAGHVIETAIASEEEMEGVLEERHVTVVESAPALPEPSPSVEQLAILHDLCIALGREEPTPDVLTFSSASALIRQMQGEECAKLGHKLKLSEKEYRAIVSSYTTNGKVLWENVKSALLTMQAEASLPAGA